ncbi:hypothetical protein TNCV_637881 [Trichonephila clavipes]|nr:hypothetical protein TNCV_637881 [Trichonephila clavipes]
MLFYLSCAQDLVVYYTIEDAPICDAASRVAMISELRVHAATNVIKLFVQTLVVSQTTSTLVLGLMTWLHDPLNHAANIAFLTFAGDRRPLRSSGEFQITVLNSSISYSANSHWILTYINTNTAIR